MPILKGKVTGIGQPFIIKKNQDQFTIFVKKQYGEKHIEITLFGELIYTYLNDMQLASQIIFTYKSRKCKKTGIIYLM